MASDRGTLLATMVLRSMWNNPRVSAWTLLTLATCAALVTVFATIGIEVRARMSRALRDVGANAVAYPAGRGKSDWERFERAARSQGVRFARLTVRVGLIAERPVGIVAGDPQALLELTPYWAVTGERAWAPGEGLVGRRVAEALGLHIGQTVRIDWPAGGQPSSLAVAGIVEAGDEDDDRVFIAPPTGPGDFTYALLSDSDGESGIARLQAALTATPLRIDVRPLRQIVHGEERVLDTVSVLGLAALAAVLALTALGVSASMLARVVERRKEFALLQALGAHRTSVVKFLLAEAATLGGVASLGGFALGTLLAAFVVRQVFDVSISPHALAFAAALVVTTAVALLAGAIACRRMLGLQPAVALRGD